MRAIRLHSSGGPDRLVLDELPDLSLVRRALDRVASGAWRPLVGTYPLADAARAHADLEQRRALGEVVLTTS